MAWLALCLCPLAWPKSHSSASTLDLGSCSSSPLSFIELVQCNLPDNNRETARVVLNLCVFESTMRTHTPRDPRRGHQRCFRYPTHPTPTLRRGQKAARGFEDARPAMNVHGNVHGSMCQAGVYGTAPKDNSQFILAYLTNAIPVKLKRLKESMHVSQSQSFGLIFTDMRGSIRAAQWDSLCGSGPTTL